MRSLHRCRLFGLRRLALVVSACLLDASSAVRADERGKLYCSGSVIQFDIEVDKASLESLRHEPRKSVKTTRKVGDKGYRDVGINVIGAAGSFRGIDDKPALTLNMDKFAK